MPIYEYECTKCGDRFELRRNMADSDSEIKCPHCGKEQPRRVFSAFGTVGTATSTNTCSPSSFT